MNQQNPIKLVIQMMLLMLTALSIIANSYESDATDSKRIPAEDEGGMGQQVSAKVDENLGYSPSILDDTHRETIWSDSLAHFSVLGSDAPHLYLWAVDFDQGLIDVQAEEEQLYVRCVRFP